MHIVLAVSTETGTTWVVDGAADFARKTAASVAVVSVDEVELERLAAAPRTVYLEQAARAVGEAVERLEQAGLEATATVLSGRAAERVADFARDQAADVVVVGASSRPSLASRLLGSVPRDLVQRAPCPVLVLPTPS